MKYVSILLLLFVSLLPIALGQTVTGAFFPLDKIKPGMIGVGRTTFQGNTLEEFQAEILGVISGVPSPQQSIIIAKLSGGQIGRTRVFAGMSGSPVYIDGRLLGAVALAYPFATDAYAGITPIQYILDVGRRDAERNSSLTRRADETILRQAAEGRPGWSTALFQSTGLNEIRTEDSIPASPRMLLPIAVPLSVSGFPVEALRPIWPELSKIGFLPVAGVSAGAAIAPLARYDDQTFLPGSTITLQLMRGDMSLEAAGTVTYREGTNIYAFGHRLFNLGATEMPISEASVVTVVPNLFNSFKISSTRRPVGTLSQDRNSGIYGRLGVAARMIPVSVDLKNSGAETKSYRFEIVNDPTLTPLLAQIAVLGSLNLGPRSVGDVTLRVAGSISVRGENDVILGDRFSRQGQDAALRASDVVALPVLLLLSSGFPQVEVQGIKLEIESNESRSAGTLDRIWVDRSEAGRGDTLQLQIYAHTSDGRQYLKRLPIEVPRAIPVGPLKILVGDGAALQALDPTANAVAGSLQNLGQLVRTLNRIRRSDHLYVQLLRSSNGAVINNEELPSLPPSVLATMGSSPNAGGYKPVPFVRLKEIEVPPADFLINGQREITVSIVK